MFRAARMRPVAISGGASTGNSIILGSWGMNGFLRALHLPSGHVTVCHGKSLICEGFNGKIIYKWAMVSMAMLNNQRDQRVMGSITWNPLLCPVKRTKN